MRVIINLIGGMFLLFSIIAFYTPIDIHGVYQQIHIKIGMMLTPILISMGLVLVSNFLFLIGEKENIITGGGFIIANAIMMMIAVSSKELTDWAWLFFIGFLMSFLMNMAATSNWEPEDIMSDNDTDKAYWGSSILYSTLIFLFGASIL